MVDALRHKTVAVAVIYDPLSEKFLLWHNKRWNGYAFPMKHCAPGNDDDAMRAAIAAVQEREFPLSLPRAQAQPIDRVGECRFSDGVHQYTYYDYHVYAIDPGTSIRLGPADIDLRQLTYDELIAASSVTDSTKSIARALVEDRRIAAAVISRDGNRGREFLLVYNKNYQYFLPATRMKTDTLAVNAALQAVRDDLGYDGSAECGQMLVVDVVQPSRRFGAHQGQFHFHLCHVDFPEIDLNVHGNGLEQSLNVMQAAWSAGKPAPAAAHYWGWFTEDEMRQRADMSPSLALVLNTALQLAE